MTVNLEDNVTFWKSIILSSQEAGEQTQFGIDAGQLRFNQTTFIAIR